MLRFLALLFLAVSLFGVSYDEPSVFDMMNGAREDKTTSAPLKPQTHPSSVDRNLQNQKGGANPQREINPDISSKLASPQPERITPNDERFGIWGGLSERERRKLKRRAV